MEGVVMADLVELAERLIAATAEVESVREAMKRLLLNGGGGESPKPNPPRAQRLGGQESRSQKSQSKRSQSQASHPNAIKSAAEEAKIVELIKTRPGLKGAEIARTLAVKPNTASQRLARLSARGEIARGADGAWAPAAASAAP
jgi:hypothetical protein